eukprot:CAMPEP_0196727264 /NCGR_PEP_ID=MMETSP1091-20130531/8294_1 /TAXON_ID=302021 /ORGANISM="Rhodomonas sp., Strain CCMP768" /LENGTH=81 /DNA_ID=CAMNT_0042069827 /DNA_START=75 /DNA_END=320 /DNA_ORIENTATION=+
MVTFQEYMNGGPHVYSSRIPERQMRPSTAQILSNPNQYVTWTQAQPARTGPAFKSQAEQRAMAVRARKVNAAAGTRSVPVE